VSRPTLFLSYDRDFDWLECAAFGVVMDRQGADRWRGVSENFGWFLATPGGAPIGFKVLEFSQVDPEHDELTEIFSGPRFDVPALGLHDITAGEILAAPSFLAGESTVDRHFFDAAMGAHGEEALSYWTGALQAGNCMAHYGAGYTLLSLGRPHEAYRHLRAYTELVAADAWAWAYRAKAAVALGEVAEAIACSERAIELEREYGEETDAGRLLDELRRGDARRHRG
jgi:tetratricopeptide (TPR) repeat protein